jgi:hypothetical protein
VPVGYAHVRSAKVPACVADRKAVELSRLYLLASAQGTGLGGALMLAVARGGRGARRRTVWLGAYDRNVKALAFYARRGFVQVGTHEFEFGGQIYADPVLTRPVTEADLRPTMIRASQNIPGDASMTSRLSSVRLAAALALAAGFAAAHADDATASPPPPRSRAPSSRPAASCTSRSRKAPAQSPKATDTVKVNYRGTSRRRHQVRRLGRPRRPDLVPAQPA